MTSNGAIDPQLVNTVNARAKTLINAQLKEVCRKANLPVSGVKGALQQRILDRLHYFASKNDVANFNMMRGLINDPRGSANVPPIAPSPERWGYNAAYTPPTPYAPPPYQNNGLPRPMPTYQASPHHSPYASAKPNFKDTPFYQIVEPVTPPLEIKGLRENTRDNTECKINLRGDIADRLSQDESLRIMVYCTQEPILPFGSKVDITFPQQFEVKVNGDDVRANFRGLKNKPGSTRPTDITSYLRKRAGYENGFKVTYALTQKVEKPGSVISPILAKFSWSVPGEKFYVVVNLVKTHTPQALLSRLLKGKVISKEQVKREMLSRNSDDDIETTSSIMSLKCPISAGRIQNPCRSTVCYHNQCFDAMSFLQQNEQIPTWQCPVCNKMVTFEALEIDKYVEDILQSTSRNTEQVTVEPTGEWHAVGIERTGQRSPSADDDEDDDADLVEVQEPMKLPSVRQNSIIHQNTHLQTPPISASSREQSSSSTRPTPTGSKRPAAQTIDLTLSDDDDPPRPPPKRQMTSNPNLTPAPYMPSSGPMPHRPPSIGSAPYNYTPHPPPNSPGRPLSSKMSPHYPFS